MNEPGDLHAFLFGKGYHAIPFFQNAVGHLLVEVTINGVTGIFILDTGAGSTIVDTKQAERLKLRLQRNNSTHSGAGAGGQNLEVIPTEGNILEMGSYRIGNFPISVMSLFEHVSQALE